MSHSQPHDDEDDWNDSENENQESSYCVSEQSEMVMKPKMTAVFRNGARAKLIRLESFLVSGEYSDFTVHFSNETLRVYKAGLCSQSPFFEKACKNFKVCFSRCWRPNNVDLNWRAILMSTNMRVMQSLPLTRPCSRTFTKMTMTTRLPAPFASRNKLYMTTINPLSMKLCGTG
jgi:hypothetical protein